jgi:hypothetical protein
MQPARLLTIILSVLTSWLPSLESMRSTMLHDVVVYASSAMTRWYTTTQHQGDGRHKDARGSTLSGAVGILPFSRIEFQMLPEVVGESARLKSIS